MVIHHDKMAYGRLASLTEKLSDERLAKMAKMLSDGQNEEQKEEDQRSGKPDPGPSFLLNGYSLYDTAFAETGMR